MTEVDLNFPRTWLEFTDPADADRMFRCDATWLASRWTCIFGSGCRGIYATAPDFGCCTLGAHFSDKDDRRHTRKMAARLTDATWQFRPEGLRRGIVMRDSDGERQTRTVDGACIFLNRRGFEGGEGCALHLMALREGEDPQSVKPDVCWQLPIRREYESRTWADGSASDVVVISEYDRRGWGPGGHDLDWYCSGATEAHVGADPVYVSERAALVALMGEPGYQELVRLIESPTTVLPHPADTPP